MSVIPNSVTVNKINVNGVDIKEAYANGVKVFTNGVNIYPGANVVTQYTNNNVTVDGFKITRPALTTGYGLVYIPINVTNLKSLVIKGTLQGFVGMCLANNIPAGGASDIYNIVYNRNTYYNMFWNYNNQSNDAVVKTIDETIDVSKITGTYYMSIALFGSDATAPKSDITIDSVVGIE